ncbi:MAG: hypothetical protein QM664_12180 [Flavihumibacter sp.]
MTFDSGAVSVLSTIATVFTSGEMVTGAGVFMLSDIRLVELQE